MSGKKYTICKTNRDRLRNAAHGACALIALAVLAVAPSALANHVQVKNVELLSGGLIQFDISWENSWRESWLPMAESADPVESWDAAWVFVKFRKTGQQTVYSHATLSTNASDHSVPEGVAIDVGLTSGREPGEGVGVFLYRDTTGNPGSNNWTGVKLKWENVKDGAASGEVEIQVHAIEMVYVPEGAFKAGTGANENGSFKNGTTSDAFLVDATWSGPVDSTPNARRIGEIDGQLWGFSTSGGTTIGPAGALHNNYPTGYAAFYGASGVKPNNRI
jgi:hypothetical protein